MLVTPGWAITRWLGRSTSRMLRIWLSEISTPSSTGSAPPERPEPAPRATKGTPARWHARTTAWTSAVELGSTTAPGVTAYCRRPSDS